MFGHIIGLFSDPPREWENIRQKIDQGKCSVVKLVLILAALPPIAGYIGTTQFGWQIGGGEAIRLTNASAGMIAILYYFSIVAGIFIVGYMIHWMGETYGADAALPQSLAVAAFTALPVLLIGIFEIYPILWLNFIIGLAALAYAVYLLYTGVPIMLKISPERGFLYSSAVMAFGLVALVSLLIVTAFLWGSGVAPAFK